MEQRIAKDRLKLLVQRYKYPLAVLAIGLGLMLMPSGGSAAAESPAPTQAPAADLESTLEAILSQIQGVGQVQVLLTEDTGREVVYQTDLQSDNRDGSVSQNITTIIITDDQRSESGLIRQTREPSYRGAVVVCQGGDDPSVRLAVVEAVQCVTGLGTNEISVLKMK